MNYFRLITTPAFNQIKRVSSRQFSSFGPILQLASKPSSGSSIPGKPEQPNRNIKGPVINDGIIAKVIKLINEEGELVGTQRTSDVLKDLDTKVHVLVQVTNDRPPTCKIMVKNDWLKQQKQKQKNSKNLNKLSQVKELILNNSMAPNDYARKIEQGAKFLEKGHTLNIALQNKVKDPEAYQNLRKLMEEKLKLKGVIHSQSRGSERSLIFIWKPLDQKAQ